MKNPFSWPLANSESIDSPVQDRQSNSDKDPEAAVKVVPDVSAAENSDDNIVSQDAQDGVKKVEAATIVWTKKELIWAYVL